MSTVLEIKSMVKDQPFMHFEGKVLGCYPREEVTGQYPGTRQTMTLEDTTGRMQFQFKNCDDFKASTGDPVVIDATHSKQHGWLGLRYSPYESKKYGTVQNVVITKSAKIQIGSINSTPPAPPPPAVPVASPAPVAPTAPPIPLLPAKQITNSSIRTMCLSYAKDLCVAGKIAERVIFNTAEDMVGWVTDGHMPPVEFGDIHERDAQLLAEEKVPTAIHEETIPF